MQLLGTGARDCDEYDPKDKETRRNAFSLFDERILIDCGPVIPVANVLLRHLLDMKFHIVIVQMLWAGSFNV